MMTKNQIRKERLEGLLGGYLGKINPGNGSEENWQKKPKRYWTVWGNVEAELKELIEKLGHFPSSKEIAEAGVSSLSNAIKIHGGANEVRKRMGFKEIEFSVDKFRTWLSMRKELTRLVEKLGHFPSAGELQEQGLSVIISAAYKYHSNFKNVRERMGYSLEERNYATKQGLQEGLKEMWAKHPELNGSVPPDNWMRANNLASLGCSIVRYHGGFRKLREELGHKKLQRYRGVKLGRWEVLIEELQKMYDQHPELKGKLPSIVWMRKNDYQPLGDAIFHRHGGFRKVRQKLGQVQLREEDGAYTDFNRLKEKLEEIIKNNPELNGKTPSVLWLKEHDYNSLNTAIYKHHGGIDRVRIKLGESLLRKQRGYWKDWNNFESEMKKIIERFGYIPGVWTLNKWGYKTLAAASFCYHGGIKAVRERMGCLQNAPLTKIGDTKISSLLEQYAGVK